MGMVVDDDDFVYNSEQVGEQDQRVVYCRPLEVESLVSGSNAALEVDCAGSD